jgi:hypothetical protein
LAPSKARCDRGDHDQKPRDPVAKSDCKNDTQAGNKAAGQKTNAPGSWNIPK